MTPIFKNVKVTADDIGNFMIIDLKKSGNKLHNTRYLISSMFGKKILLITPLIKWYLENSFVVTKLHKVIQFQPQILKYSSKGSLTKSQTDVEQVLLTNNAN